MYPFCMNWNEFCVNEDITTDTTVYSVAFGFLPKIYDLHNIITTVHLHHELIFIKSLFVHSLVCFFVILCHHLSLFIRSIEFFLDQHDFGIAPHFMTSRNCDFPSSRSSHASKLPNFAVTIHMIRFSKFLVKWSSCSS